MGQIIRLVTNGETGERSYIYDSYVSKAFVRGLARMQHDQEAERQTASPPRHGGRVIRFPRPRGSRKSAA